jgi:16S rRNA (cytidine1402-2'-O)-methyltransferase
VNGQKTPRERSYHLGGVAFAAPPLDPALYLVATPIGNLRDITLRALETLAAADVVASEDTRVTGVLLKHYAIAQRPVAYHEHNAAEAGPRLLAAIEEGKSVALVSDAGTPLVSDPGFRLVTEALAKGFPVVPVPGASSVLAALTASGLPTDSFFFAGFLPSKSGQRRARLEELKAVPGTLVVFESPRRLAASLADMASMLGDRPAVVARELTKMFEERRRGTLAELAAHYAREGPPRGEVVVCVAPPEEADAFDAAATDRLLLDLADEMPASRAAAEAARMTGERKGELYRRLLALKGSDR